ncbi:MAG: response regulator transcription factor [Clostridia bacterium]|nr:response regulator transcription factor [Clostridia bacterium]
MTPKILIVDDEKEIRNILSLLLSASGYEVYEASNGIEAVEAAGGENEPDLIIMDIMMPSLSGVEATRRIREFSHVPVLFLTAKSLDEDKKRAYLSGGDDYLVKPFSSSELLLKVESLLRRYLVYHGKQIREENRLSETVRLDPAHRTVTRNGKPVELRDKEIDILMYFFHHRGEIIDASSLYEGVWGEIALPSSSNTVMVHILNLRRKLEEDPSSPKIIRTVWGKGYQMDEY